MFKSVNSHIAKSLIAVMGAATIGSVTIGQVASAGEYWTPANAPITYKMANPADMMAFAPAPMPQYAAIPQAAPQMRSTFDPSKVDTTLYSHQRVGNTYTVAGNTYTPQHQPDYDMVGTASWYGDKFHGKLTASGEKYNKNAMTAAHKTLPLNSLVVVTNLQTGTSITVRINDRGPFIGNRIIDLSEAAATIMGFKTTGLGDVRVQYAGPADTNAVDAVPQKQAMRPVMPAPQYVAPAPQYAAPAPQYAAPALPQPQYQPLRDMNAAPAPKVAALQQPMVQVPNVMNPVSIAPQATLPNAPYAIPQAYIPPATMGNDDTVVTMTIKGPIHMATQNSHAPRGQLIKAVNRTTYKTVK